jgi:hypothetical protein
MTQKLELAVVIKALREELQQAQITGEGQDIRFQTNSIEVEFQTVVDYEVGAEGGVKIKFLVLDIDAKGTGKYKRSQTHKIKLSLMPRKQNPDGTSSDLMLSDDE